MDFWPTLTLIFSVKIRSIQAFFDLKVLKLCIKPSLNEFAEFVLYIYQQKDFLVFCYFD